MKKGLVLVVSMALLVLIIGVGGCTWTSPPKNGSTGLFPEASIVLSQQNTGIWVTGEGKVTVVPDVAILNLGVEAQADTVAEAQRQAAEAMDALMSELDSYDVAGKDIKTQQFNIYPVRRRDRDKEILVGYRVSNTVTVKIRKVDNAGLIIDAVARVAGDYTRINGISFTVDDPTSYQEEARKKAMDDAEAKANYLADLADVKLGKPTYISEAGVYVPIVREFPMMAFEGAPAISTPISPGETEISLTVQVAYSIR